MTGGIITVLVIIRQIRIVFQQLAEIQQRLVDGRLVLRRLRVLQRLQRRGVFIDQVEDRVGEFLVFAVS